MPPFLLDLVKFITPVPGFMTFIFKIKSKVLNLKLKDKIKTTLILISIE